jgi:hypothetical protein
VIASAINGETETRGTPAGKRGCHEGLQPLQIQTGVPGGEGCTTTRPQPRIGFSSSCCREKLQAELTDQPFALAWRRPSRASPTKASGRPIDIIITLAGSGIVVTAAAAPKLSVGLKLGLGIRPKLRVLSSV